MPSQPDMSIARDIHVHACSIQLASLASVASTFGALMYEMLILRLDIVGAVGAFAISLLMIDTSIVNGGDMQILGTHLQDMCGTSRSTSNGV